MAFSTKQAVKTRPQIETARAHLAKAATPYLALTKAIRDDDPDAIKTAHETMADHLDGAMSAAKAVDSMLEPTTKDDAFTEGQQGQQQSVSTLMANPKKNTDVTVDNKTQGQIAFLLSDGAPTERRAKKRNLRTNYRARSRLSQ